MQEHVFPNPNNRGRALQYTIRRVSEEWLQKEQSEQYLNKDGFLCFEIGYNQAEPVTQLMKDKGFIEVNVKKDYAGLDRVVYGTYLPMDSL